MIMAKAPKRLDKPIAWVCRTYEQDGKTEVEVIREGMLREEIIAEFPPHWRGGLEYNRRNLVKAIIYEAYLEVAEGREERPRNNVRGFWYERLLHTLIRVAGEPGDPKNMDSIDTTINEAWKDLIEDGWVLYDTLNIYSEKEDAYYIGVREDSPYPTAIVMVEKAALYEVLHDIADTYEIGFCCTGGQNSRAAAMAYVDKLERMGVDLEQEFTVYSFADFDPEGWDIPISFVGHLKLRVPGDIKLVRLGVLREQLGESVIKHQAAFYPLEAENESAKKGKLTKYKRFVEETGGLFIPDTSGNLVPGRVELNIYEPAQIREKILQGLAEHIDGFPYQLRPIRQAFGIAHEEVWSEHCHHAKRMLDYEYQPYYSAIRATFEKLDVVEATRAVEERRRIRELRKEIDRLMGVVGEKTADIDAQRDTLLQLENKLGEQQAAAWNEAEIELRGVDELIETIEQNGGWRDWAEDLPLTILGGEAVADAARHRNSFYWRPDESEQDLIRDWIWDKGEPSSWWPDDTTPAESPEEWVAQALNGEI